MILYALRDPRTQEIRYIGKSIKTADERFRHHLKKSTLSRKNHRTTWILSLLKLGLKPIMQVLRDDIQIEEHLNAEEISTIAFCREAGFDLVNGTDGGEGGLGYKHTEATKEKLRILGAKSLGRRLSEESKQKIRLSAIGNQRFKGKIHSLKTKFSISQKMLGNKRFQGKRHTEATKKAIGAARRDANTRKMYVDSNGNFYHGREEIKRILVIGDAMIHRALRGISIKKLGGLTLTYVRKA